MGERKGVNKYYPPDYDPSKGGLNKSQGTHALRERASKLHLGILIIRFEMPYNIWCDGCENHIGTGVRYNAEKKKVGMYYTTPIYEFRMKCHLCDNYFVIKTDPGNLDYEITSGARRQERRWDPTDNEQIAPEDKAVARKMAADAMFKLEHDSEDKDKIKMMGGVLEELEDFQASRWEDNFSANQLLRQKFRIKENAIKAQQNVDKRHNLPVALLAPSAEDERTAALLALKQKSPDNRLKKRSEISAESVFAKFKSGKLSKETKKEIAKQTVSNLVAAKQPNFDNFKNNFDNKFKNLVRVKSKNNLNKDKQNSYEDCLKANNNSSVLNNIQNNNKSNSAETSEMEYCNTIKDNSSSGITNTSLNDSKVTSQPGCSSQNNNSVGILVDYSGSDSSN